MCVFQFTLVKWSQCSDYQPQCELTKESDWWTKSFRAFKWSKCMPGKNRLPNWLIQCEGNWSFLPKKILQQSSSFPQFSCRYEIKSIKKTSYMRGIQLSFIMYSTRISIFGSILAYVLLGHNITAEKVFVLTCFYNILRQTMTVFFPSGIGQVKHQTKKWKAPLSHFPR